VRSAWGFVRDGWRAATSTGPSYERQPRNRNVDTAQVGRYFIDFRAKTAAASAATPSVLGPAPLAQLALGWWERALEGDDDAGPMFDRICRLLATQAKPRGEALLWEYSEAVPKYDLHPPWHSAMAQGQIASVFVRSHIRHGDEDDARRARAALQPLLDGGESTVTTTDAGPVLEEAPSVPASHILNGWVYALWGLWDVALALDHADARTLFEQSVSALGELLPRYDTGWWTRYSLYPHRLPDLAKPFYHRLHVDQMQVLHELTRDERFSEAAVRWRSYDTPSNRSKALAQKLVFAAAGARGEARRRSPAPVR
jgi:heparosan-N-sulfate-glucuronate 5-epimerase